MISCSIQFFSNYLANNGFVERLSTLRKIFPEGFINHCLVAISSFFRSYTEIINDIRVKIHVCASKKSYKIGAERVTLSPFKKKGERRNEPEAI
jgi:hypothetical protein